MDFGEKREVGREILSLSNLLYRKIEYDKKKSGIYDLQYVQGGIIKYIKENPQKDIFPRYCEAFLPYTLYCCRYFAENGAEWIY